MTIETRPLENFGAEVIGVDLARDRAPATIAALRQLWAENGVLLFRGQDLDEADIVDFSRQFGALEIHVREEYLSREHPELLLVSNLKQDGKPIGILSDHDVGWHHDQIYLEKPAVGSLLYSVKIPSRGGNTAFCNQAAAYAALPDEKKRQIDGLRAIQSYEYFNRQWSEPTSATQKKRTPDVVHPLVRTHPITGRKAIYADPGMTAGIEGMADEDAQALLRELYDWCLLPRFCYDHQWRLGDALMWDNASTMHRRGAFDPSAERLMKRTTILPPPDRAVPF
jgi:taurine dioxygenase